MNCNARALLILLNMRISFRDIASGGAIKNIPISSLVTVEPTSTLGSVKRKNQEKGYAHFASMY